MKVNQRNWISLKNSYMLLNRDIEAAELLLHSSAIYYVSWLGSLKF